ncbi:hypothetical protein PALB_13400 [Pseudoalteromonas luteoviolacea B = ATCC 29581]|nr:hypothetical protein PALB_13400 [Pseudoalteromonas luteoviolacea B = ATCC 29581]
MAHLYLFCTCLLLFFTSFGANAQRNDELSFYRYFYGVNYQMLNVNDINAGTDLDMQVDDTAHAIGLYFKGEPWSFVQYSVGIDVMRISDDNPFTQEVENNLTGNVSNRQSNVLGKALYGEFGLKHDFTSTKNLTLGILGGYRYNSVSRSIFRCSSCEEQKLNSFESSFYAKSFVEYQFTRHVHLQLYYNYYFNDTGFSDGVGLQVSFHAQ